MVLFYKLFRESRDLTRPRDFSMLLYKGHTLDTEKSNFLVVGESN